MALSTPPPPPDPLSTTTSTSTSIATPTTTISSTTPPRPIFPPNSRPPPSHPHPNTSHPFQGPFFSNHPHHHHPNPGNSRLPSNPNPNYPHLVPSSHSHEVGAAPTSTTASAILYPVASSGRGFLTKQTPAVTLANPNPTSPLYQSRPGLSYPRPPFGYSHSDPGLAQGMGYVTGRPAHVQHSSVVGNATGVMPGVIKGVPVSGASSQSQHKLTISPNPNSDCNGHKDIRDRSKDESAFVTIRDRKVRISDNTSVYALCRSWLRNGFPEENQLPYMDSVRSLPRPLPLSAQDVISPQKKDDDKEEEEEEVSIEDATPQELLQRHVKRAKRVRSRLREERLQRIARYKTRLALLLPPMVDPQLRNDIAPGN